MGIFLCLQAVAIETSVDRVQPNGVQSQLNSEGSGKQLYLAAWVISLISLEEEKTCTFLKNKKMEYISLIVLRFSLVIYFKSH